MQPASSSADIASRLQSLFGEQAGSIADQIAASIPADDPRAVLDLLTELLTAADAARLLGVTTQTLYRWRAAGEGPIYTQYPGGSVRYLRIDLLTWPGKFRRTNTIRLPASSARPKSWPASEP